MGMFSEEILGNDSARDFLDEIIAASDQVAFCLQELDSCRAHLDRKRDGLAPRSMSLEERRELGRLFTVGLLSSNPHMPSSQLDQMATDYRIHIEKDEDVLTDTGEDEAMRMAAFGAVIAMRDDLMECPKWLDLDQLLLETRNYRQQVASLLGEFLKDGSFPEMVGKTYCKNLRGLVKLLHAPSQEA